MKDQAVERERREGIITPSVPGQVMPRSSRSLIRHQNTLVIYLGSLRNTGWKVGSRLIGSRSPNWWVRRHSYPQSQCG